MRPRFKQVGPKLSREEAVRQGRAVQAAHAAFHTLDGVRAFMNTHHDGLEGRPIDLAVASDAGLVAVEAAIREAPAGPPQASPPGDA